MLRDGTANLDASTWVSTWQLSRVTVFFFAGAVLLYVTIIEYGPSLRMRHHRRGGNFSGLTTEFVVTSGPLFGEGAVALPADQLPIRSAATAQPASSAALNTTFRDDLEAPRRRSKRVPRASHPTDMSDGVFSFGDEDVGTLSLSTDDGGDAAGGERHAWIGRPRRGCATQANSKRSALDKSAAPVMNLVVLVNAGVRYDAAASEAVVAPPLWTSTLRSAIHDVVMPACASAVVVDYCTFDRERAAALLSEEEDVGETDHLGIDANLTSEVDARRYLAEPQLTYPLSWLGWTVPRVCVEHTEAGTWEAALESLVHRVSHSVEGGHDAHRRYTLLTLNVSGHKYFEWSTSEGHDWPSAVFTATRQQSQPPSRDGITQQLPCFGNLLSHCHPAVPRPIIEGTVRTSEWRPVDRMREGGDAFAVARIEQRGKLVGWIRRDVERQDAYGTAVAFQSRRFSDSPSTDTTSSRLPRRRGGTIVEHETIVNMTEANDRRRRDFYAFLRRIAANGTRAFRPQQRRRILAQDVDVDSDANDNDDAATRDNLDKNRTVRIGSQRRNITSGLPVSSCADISRLRGYRADVPFMSVFISGQLRAINRTLDSLQWAARGKVSLWLFALITVDSRADPVRRDLSDEEVRLEVAGWNRLMSFPSLLGVLVFDVQPIRAQLIVKDFHRGWPYVVKDSTRPDRTVMQWYITFAGNAFRRMYESRCQLVAARKHRRVNGRRLHRGEAAAGSPPVPFRLDTAHESRPMQFDLSMRLRTDTVMLEPCPLAKFWDGKLHIPAGWDFGGINDQWSVGEPRFHDVAMQSAFVVDQGITQWRWPFHGETVFSMVLSTGAVTSQIVRDGCYGLLYKDLQNRFDYKWVRYSTARITQDIESSRRNRSDYQAAEDYPTFRRFRSLRNNE